MGAANLHNSRGVPTRRAVVRQRASEKPCGPTPFNRNPARDVRPAPVPPPDPPPRLQMSSNAEIVNAVARVRQQGKKAEEARKEKIEAGRRKMKEAVAAHMEKERAQQPLRATVSGPGKGTLPTGAIPAATTRLPDDDDVCLSDRKRARDAAKAVEEEKRRKKNAASKQS